jgi:hypothetical protein
MDLQHPQAEASQDTLIPLQQIEPSPIESPIDPKDFPELPPPATAPKSSVLGLSGSGHGAVYYCMPLKADEKFV